MKVAVSYLIIVAFLSSYAIAQEITQDRTCDLFGSLHYKNGKSMVVIKVTYKDLFRSPEELLFKELDKRKKLRYRNYFADCCGGGSMGFIPENCSNEYMGTMSRWIKFDTNKLKTGQIVYLTCFVFDGVRDDKHIPFFTINSISLEKHRK